jgi:hypothetical protein
MYYFKYEKGSQVFIALAKKPQKYTKALLLTRDEWKGWASINDTIQQGLEAVGLAESSGFIHKYVADDITIYHTSKNRSPVQQIKLVTPTSNIGKNIASTVISKIESRGFSKDEPAKDEPAEEKPAKSEKKPPKEKKASIALVLRELGSIITA